MNARENTSICLPVTVESMRVFDDDVEGILGNRSCPSLCLTVSVIKMGGGFVCVCVCARSHANRCSQAYLYLPCNEGGTSCYPTELDLSDP